MNLKTHLIATFLLMISFQWVQAQPRGGDPNEMIAREKQNLMAAITDLSDDQKMLIDGIYEEFSQSFSEIREEARQNRDWDKMRPKMEALRKEKDALMADVLNEEQLAKYQKLNEARRERREGNQQPNP